MTSSWNNLSSCFESQWTKESLFSVTAQRKEKFIQWNSLVHCHFAAISLGSHTRSLLHIREILLFEPRALSSSICGKKKFKEDNSFSANSRGPTVGLLSVYEFFELCQKCVPTSPHWVYNSPKHFLLVHSHRAAVTCTVTVNGSRLWVWDCLKPTLLFFFWFQSFSQSWSTWLAVDFALTF